MLGFRFLNLSNGSLLHRNTAVLVVAEFNDYSIICHIDDYTVKSAAGQYGISYCNAVSQLLLSLLLLLLRTDCHKI